jgi:HD-GYP domain-containing protein (c-di-GMP phosphodiesterase class II)
MMKQVIDKMEWYQSSVYDFESYVDSYTGLNPEQQRNFTIKKEHTLRVADNVKQLSSTLNLTSEEEQAGMLAAIFHDIGRFRQIVEFNTLNDLASMDHAELAIEIMKEKQFLSFLNDEMKDLIMNTIRFHNKYELPRSLNTKELFQAQLLRDADKLDILKVLAEYYSSKNQNANHMLTWELPKSSVVSQGVAREILAGKQVSKKEVKNETDVKIMQLSWIYDINFKPTIELILRRRFLENIYNSLPKNDQIFEIYRKVKVFAENKMLK